MTHRTQRGFTLIELMIVVAILGLLAAIAIPAFSKYVRRSKTTEAVMNIRRIFDGAVKYYTEDHAARGTNEAIPNQFPGLGLDSWPRSRCQCVLWSGRRCLYAELECVETCRLARA